MERRLELKSQNIEAWEGKELAIPSKLDSSLKKNTGFIKKLKVFHSDQVNSVVKDIESLSLSKYLSEINQSIYEGLIKTTKTDEVSGLVEVISKLHQRFKSQFSNQLMIDMIQGSLNIFNEDDEAIKLSRQKNLLKFFMELTLVGVIRTIKDVDKSLVPDKFIKRLTKNNVDDLVIFFILKDLMQTDLNNGTYLPILSSFLKRYYPMLKDFWSGEEIDQFNQIFNIYLSANTKILHSLHQELNSKIKQYNKSNLKYGKIFDDKTNDLNDLREMFDTFNTNVKLQSNILNLEFNELVVDELTINNDQHQTIELIKTKDNEDLKFWESVQEENFYTIIPNLDNLNLDDNHDNKFNKYQNKTDGEKISIFLQDFENLSNENDVLDLVIIFNKLNLNNKATKNRLFKFFTESNLSINFKIYAKFLKINQSQVQDLLDELLEFFEVKLRGQIFNDKLSFKFIYFYIELIKFKLIPNFMIFHKIRSLILNLTSSNNIDLLTVIFEKCGRFLIYDLDYNETMTKMIDLLKDQKKSANLPINVKLALSNLILIIEQPTISNKLVKPKFSPEQQFLIKLIKNNLNSENMKIILKIVKKIDLINDPNYNNLIIKLFTDYEFINLNNLGNLILFLKKVVSEKENSVLLTKIVDELIENIIRGCELNDYRMNRQRVLQIKLLSEIFNKKLIAFSLIIDLSYKVLNLGHENNQPLPLNYNISIDMPNNFFRIQLICILFNSLKNVMYQYSNSNKKLNDELKKINNATQEKYYIFLTYFQYYIFCKEPVPLEIEFQIMDLFNHANETIVIERFESLPKVLAELKDILAKKNRDKVVVKDEEEEEDELDKLHEYGVDAEDDDDEEAEENSDDDSDDDDDDDISDDDVEDEDDDDEDDTSEDDDEDDEDEEEEEEENLPPQRSELDIKFEQDLDKELNQLIKSSYSNTTTNARNKPLNIAVPKTDGNKFNLLLKGGKKTSVKEISFNDREITDRILQEKAQIEANKRRVMDLVMNMEQG